MPNTSERVLVTGAGGFIGSHLVEQLLARGNQVRAVVTYRSNGTIGWLSDLPAELTKNLEVFRGDIRDPHGMEVAAQDCGSILHLAALIGIPYSYHSPESYVDTNIKGTLNILQAARKLKIKKVVCTSTSEVYGTAQTVPITEEHRLIGQSPYSATKIAADQLAISFSKSFDLPVTIIRPFNTFGPRQSERAVIPTIIAQMLQPEPKISIGSVAPTRDFVFVEDTVRGFLAALDTTPKGEVFNLATGFEISVGDTVLAISELMGKKVDVGQEQLRVRPQNSEVERLCGDARKALAGLGWKPQHSGLDGLKKGLEKTIQWMSLSSAQQYQSPGKYSI